MLKVSTTLAPNEASTYTDEHKGLDHRRWHKDTPRFVNLVFRAAVRRRVENFHGLLVLHEKILLTYHLNPDFLALSNNLLLVHRV